MADVHFLLSRLNAPPFSMGLPGIISLRCVTCDRPLLVRAPRRTCACWLQHLRLAGDLSWL